jgi:hypothetical protein
LFVDSNIQQIVECANCRQFIFGQIITKKKAPEGASFGLDFVAVNFKHCDNYADEVSFVCVPVLGGDSALFSELGALGDELGVVGDCVD